MKIRITRTEEFKGKGDAIYRTVHGLNPATGKTFMQFVNKEQYDLVGTIAPTPKTVSDALNALPEVDVEFNERGRLESILLPEEEE